MSNKKTADYQKLIRHLEIDPKDFLMVGNSYKSDIEPVIQLGASAIHIPYHITWIHEQTEKMEKHPHWLKLKTIAEIKNLF